MKKILLLAGAWLTVSSAIAQQSDAAPKPAVFNKVTSLSELNHSGLAEAYPWISDDGLTLYYVSEESANVNQLVCVSRKTLQSAFGHKSVLFPDMKDVLGCWLNKTQTEIYFVERGHLFHAQRSMANQDFQAPVEITLDFGTMERGFFSGPSLTESQNELYLYYSGDGNTRILQFARNTKNHYSFKGELPFPAGINVRPGQITKDGKVFFTSVENDANSYSFFTLSRPAIGGAWGRMNRVGGDVNNSRTFNQCSLNANGTILVCVEAINNSWTENDLYIAYADLLPNTPDPVTAQADSTIQQADQLSIVIDEPQKVSDHPVVSTAPVKIFPNPTDADAFIQFSLPQDADLTVSVMDLSGQLMSSVQTGTLNAGVQSLQLPLRALAQGTYLVFVRDKNLQLLAQGKVVRQ